MSTSGRCGYVAVVGRPNVGKSTLLNALVGEKVSIVSARPHTTRHRILGILNRGEDQALFVDTPGLVSQRQRVLHRVMAKSIAQSIEDADVVLMVVEAGRLTAEDRRLAEMLKGRLERTVLVVNKIDTVRPKSKLLPMLEKLAADYDFSAFLPVSALRGENLREVVDVILERLPAGPALFPRDMSTDRDLKFRIAEIIREKLLALIHQEVPYGLTVEVEYLERQQERWLVHALIWLDREGHKPIVIGKGGQLLKQAGQAARRELIDLLGGRVHLETWVKVREHWSDSEAELRRLGFDVS